MRKGISQNKKIIIKLLILFVLLIIFIWTIIQNSHIGVTSIDLHNKKIPEAFNGFKIAQLSDFHNAEFEKNNSAITESLKTQQPDIIVITGDFVDSRNTNINIAVSLIEKITDIAPCYFVTGNHESRIGEKYDILEDELLKLGVTVLHNQSVSINRNGSSISLAGVDDPDFAIKRNGTLSSDYSIISAETDAAGITDGYNILLSHRSELFEAYTEKNIDLVLSGHAHGGQFRLPFIGGLYAPDQGLLPKYDGGIYQKDNTVMIVSRGIGNSLFPFRFNNPPEIIYIVLYNGDNEINQYQL